MASRAPLVNRRKMLVLHQQQVLTIFIKKKCIKLLQPDPNNSVSKTKFLLLPAAVRTRSPRGRKKLIHVH